MIINADCFAYMDTMEKGSVDVIITDPPYDIAIGSGGGLADEKKYQDAKLKAISDGIDIVLFLEKCQKVLKKFNLFMFCSNKQIPEIMAWGGANGYSTTLLVWHKHNATPFANNVWRQDAEFIVHIREKGAVFEGSASLKTKITKLPANPSRFGHPTEKPVKLIEKFILISTHTGELVFDPFLGSGTTAVAAKSLGRRYLGCEINPEYCAIAEKRLAAVQGVLI